MGLIFPPAISFINSIQDVTINIGSTATSQTATIAAVNTAKTIIMPQFPESNDGNYRADIGHAYWELTNSTTVTLTRQVASTMQTWGRASVIEFGEYTIKSIQNVLYSHSAPVGTENKTITAVNVDKTIVIPMGVITDYASKDEWQQFLGINAELTSTTNLRLYDTPADPAGSGKTKYCRFAVVEFN